MSEQAITPIYARIALCGESNSGKTYSACTLARQLASGPEKITIIDTESRAKLYRKIFPGIKIVEMRSPYDPEKMIQALQAEAKAKTEVVIIDNSSMVWEQILMHANEMLPTVKNKVTVWTKLTPRWQAYLYAINDSQLHIINTFKMKEKIVPSAGGVTNLGKQVVSRGGNAGVKYDYQVVFTLGDDHKATVAKDNLALFSDWDKPQIITEETGKKLATWYREA